MVAVEHSQNQSIKQYFLHDSDPVKRLTSSGLTDIHFEDSIQELSQGEIAGITMKLHTMKIAVLAFLIGYSFWNTYADSQEARLTSAQYRSRTQAYIDNTRGKPPRENLKKALQILNVGGRWQVLKVNDLHPSLYENNVRDILTSYLLGVIGNPCRAKHS